MAQFENKIDLATERAEQRRARHPQAVAAYYDAERGRIVIDLSTGYALAFAPVARKPTHTTKRALRPASAGRIKTQNASAQQATAQSLNSRSRFAT